MSMASTDHPEFSKWRAYLWPIHGYELKKLLPMLMIFFLMSFAYNILHTMKDALVVTAEGSGAEALPFIKFWAMFPGAILMTFVYTRLSNRFSRDVVAYLILSIFLGFFFLFAFVLYPARASLHPHATMDTLQAALPAGFKGMIALFRNWTFTSFYVMSELWSNIILSLLLWGFANQVTRINEAKRFYGLFGIGINCSGVAAGQLTAYFSHKSFDPALPFGEDAWSQSMVILLSLVILSGIISMFLFRSINRTVAKEASSANGTFTKEEDVKGKLSLRDSFRYLMRSKYLISIAVIVLAYNIVINLVEVLWKDQVHELYSNPSDYNAYMGHVKVWIGFLATFASLFISGNSIRQFGWTVTAMITPIILFVTSIGFFAFFFVKDQPMSTFGLFSEMTPLTLVVFFGSAQNILSRAAKYTLFDATKEMAFVPLSAESKIKGKAAIDGICSRLGKGGGSVIHQSLLVPFETFTKSAPYVAAVLFGIILIWLGAIRVLGGKFAELTQQPRRVEPEGELTGQRA